MKITSKKYIKNKVRFFNEYIRQKKLCKQGVYVWRVAAVFIDGTSVEQAGDVTLIRR